MRCDSGETNDAKNAAHWIDRHKRQALRYHSFSSFLGLFASAPFLSASRFPFPLCPFALPFALPPRPPLAIRIGPQCRSGLIGNRVTLFAFARLMALYARLKLASS